MVPRACTLCRALMSLVPVVVSVALRGSVVLFVRSCAHVCAGVYPELRAWLFLCCPEAYRP